MAAFAERISSFVTWADGLSDTRTKDWFLISSPLLTYGSVVMYLIIVWIGPQLMATRRAMDLRYTMMAYNLSMVLLNGYMCYEFFASSFLNQNFNLACEPVDYSNDPQALRLANVCWWFFFSKILEFMDTFIFILRKKNNQVSFLHVYHHATMPALWWIGVRWVAGGNTYFSGMVNCFIHVLMYGYYFLSALGPQIQPFLWWKRYLTSLQLVQFFLVMGHGFLARYHDCGFPVPYIYALIVYLISHIVLFSMFYHKTYVKDKSKSPKQTKTTTTNGDMSPRSSGRYNLRERPSRMPQRS